MRQNAFGPRPRWGSLQRSPNPLAGFRDGTEGMKWSRRRGKRKGRGKGRMRGEGMRRGGEERGREGQYPS